MKVATGDLITFVDSDDYISKDFIEILFEAMLENKSDIAIANMKRTSKRDEKNTSTAWKTSNFKSEDALISMLYGIPLAHLRVVNFLRETYLRVWNFHMVNSLKIFLQSIKQS